MAWKLMAVCLQFFYLLLDCSLVLSVVLHVCRVQETSLQTDHVAMAIITVYYHQSVLCPLLDAVDSVAMPDSTSSAGNRTPTQNPTGHFKVEN